MEGCFFHFCQCLYRHIQHLGLQRHYNANVENNQLRQYVRLHAALALVPIADVPNVHAEIHEGRPQDFDINQQIDAFDE